MQWTILGSGGCTRIPRPLCRCPVCNEARGKGIPFERTGPAGFLHDENLLIDTPAEVADQLNRNGIERLDHLILTHLDPDHVEGLRVVEQVALDFRTWRAYPELRIQLVIPEILYRRIREIRSVYGPLIDFYEGQGFVEIRVFRQRTRIGNTDVIALPVDRGDQTSFVYVFMKQGRKVVYAPCDIRPFPEEREEVRNPSLLIIQPGIFETGLKHGFVYPESHISRTTLYTFEETVGLAKRIEAEQVLFVHLEEYWNRSHTDYTALESSMKGIRFAYDGMRITV